MNKKVSIKIVNEGPPRRVSSRLKRRAESVPPLPTHLQVIFSSSNRENMLAYRLAYPNLKLIHYYPVMSRDQGLAHEKHGV